MKPPDRSIARLFGVDEHPERLSGFRGRTYRAGHIVLKVAESAEEACWLGETLTQVTDNAEFRLQIPLKSLNGEWIECGFVAWSYLIGKPCEGRFAEMRRAADAFHDAVAQVERPAYFDARNDPWSRADRVAWGETTPHYAPEIMERLSPLLSARRPTASYSQLIHGDLSGNFILSDDEPPGVIDISPYWRPKGFATAIMLVDTIWAREPTVNFDAFEGIPELYQMTLRALIRRIAEQPEQIESFGKSSEAALAVVQAYLDASERPLAVDQSFS